MSQHDTPSPDDYFEVDYQQFRPGKAMRVAMRTIGILTWPLALPLAMLSRTSDILFRSCSEALSLVPYFPGVILRAEFYRFALRNCGHNVIVEFGAIFIHRDVSVGNNVLIGRYTIVHHCDIGSHVLIGERVTFLSGSKQHRFDRLDVPMALQGGMKRRIGIGDDCWIGSHATVMADIAVGSIVAAGAVVIDDVSVRTIVGGIPAKVIGIRA